MASLTRGGREAAHLRETATPTVISSTRQDGQAGAVNPCVSATAEGLVTCKREIGPKPPADGFTMVKPGPACHARPGPSKARSHPAFP